MGAGWHVTCSMTRCNEGTFYRARADDPSPCTWCKVSARAFLVVRPLQRDPPRFADAFGSSVWRCVYTEAP